MSTLTEPLALSVADYMAAIRKDASSLIDAASTAGFEAAVPTCPEWTVRDLVQHTESVYRHKTETVAGGYVDDSPAWVDVPSDSDLTTFAAALDKMIDVFESADLSKPSYTWCIHDHRADWWVRRMAHETTIHAADALSAAGERQSIPPDLAVDGIDEILDEMMVGGPDWLTLTPVSGRIDLIADDRSWSLRLARMVGTSPTSGTSYDEDALIWEPDGTPDAIVSTDPGVLNLWLWGRAALADSAVSGDRDLVARVRAIAEQATQ